MGLRSSLVTAAKLPFKASSALWKATPAQLQGAAVLSAVLAAATGLLTYEAVTARPTRRALPDDEPLQPTPPLLMPQDLILQPTSMELAGPAEGRGEFEFRNRVNAGRGQMLEQPQVNAVQPRMSAIAPDAVTDLGAPKPLGV